MLECHRILEEDGAKYPCETIFPRQIGYIFESKAWKRAAFQIIELTKVPPSPPLSINLGIDIPPIRLRLHHRPKQSPYRRRRRLHHKPLLPMSPSPLHNPSLH